MSFRPHLIQLLRLIDAKESIGPLLNAGLDYAQIAELLQDVKRENLVEEVGVELRLTEQGSQALMGARKWLGRNVRGKWVKVLEQAKIEQIDTVEVFLPESRPDARVTQSTHSRRTRPSASNRRVGESPT